MDLDKARNIATAKMLDFLQELKFQAQQLTLQVQLHVLRLPDRLRCMHRTEKALNFHLSGLLLKFHQLLQTRKARVLTDVATFLGKQL